MRYCFDIVLLDREMQSCFCINYLNQRGSAFLFWFGHRSFFVCAAHQLRGAAVGDNVLFLSDTDWYPHELTFINVHADDDVAIFTVKEFHTVGETPPPYPDPAILVGGSMLFTGFPHGLNGSYPGQGWPTPLVRRVSFSGIVKQYGRDRMVLDGFNNPGYSGGPAYGVSAQGEVALAGMISGYRFESIQHSRLYRRDENDAETVVPDLYVKPNSGMVYAVPLRSVVDLCLASGSASNPQKKV